MKSPVDICQFCHKSPTIDSSFSRLRFADGHNRTVTNGKQSAAEQNNEGQTQEDKNARMHTVFGTWKTHLEDGLQYQERIRAEWEERSQDWGKPMEKKQEQ
jgi:hypothetical protein